MPRACQDPLLLTIAVDKSFVRGEGRGCLGQVIAMFLTADGLVPDGDSYSALTSWSVGGTNNRVNSNDEDRPVSCGPGVRCHRQRERLSEVVPYLMSSC